MDTKVDMEIMTDNGLYSFNLFFNAENLKT